MHAIHSGARSIARAHLNRNRLSDKRRSSCNLTNNTALTFQSSPIGALSNTAYDGKTWLMSAVTNRNFSKIISSLFISSHCAVLELRPDVFPPWWSAESLWAHYQRYHRLIHHPFTSYPMLKIDYTGWICGIFVEQKINGPCCGSLCRDSSLEATYIGRNLEATVWCFILRKSIKLWPIFVIDANYAASYWKRSKNSFQQGSRKRQAAWTAALARNRTPKPNWIGGSFSTKRPSCSRQIGTALHRSAWTNENSAVPDGETAGRSRCIRECCILIRSCIPVQDGTDMTTKTPLIFYSPPYNYDPSSFA